MIDGGVSVVAQQVMGISHREIKYRLMETVVLEPAVKLRTVALPVVNVDIVELNQIRHDVDWITWTRIVDIGVVKLKLERIYQDIPI